MHRTMVGHGADDHKSRSYKVQVTKTGCIITRTKGHVRVTPISAENYLRKEISIANRKQLTSSTNSKNDHFAILNQQKQYDMGMEGEDIS